MNRKKWEAHQNSQIRTFPYPYNSACAFSIDSDYLSWELFLELHKYFNSTDKTRFGRGINSPISFGYFGYTNLKKQMGLYEGMEYNEKKSPYFHDMIDLIKNNALEFNHAFGDFDGGETFTRNHAIRMLDDVLPYIKGSRIFVDHGNRNNIQCIGNYPYAQGKLPNSPAFHTDLWMREIDAFTDSTLSFESGMLLDRIILNDSVPRLVYEIGRTIANTGFTVQKYDEKSGMDIYNFKRLRGTGKWAPNWDNLNVQLKIAKNILQKSAGQILFLYQHFGVLKKTNYEIVQASIENLDIEKINHLRLFVEWARENKVWVETSKKLIEYQIWISNVSIKIVENKILLNTDKIYEQLCPPKITLKNIEKQKVEKIFFNYQPIPYSYFHSSEEGTLIDVTLS